MAQQHRILFAGSMGAGKTTAIQTLSDKKPVSTEVDNTDKASFDKSTTTAAMDYGEIALANGDTIRLLGAPGQLRFAHMWPILADRSLGLILLVDNSRPDPLADLSTYLDHFGEFARQNAAVIGVGRTEQNQEPTLDDYWAWMAAHELFCPVFSVDVRQRQDVLLLLDSLLVQLEV